MEQVYSKKAVMGILDRYSVAPLKKLGQNFLIDENIAGKIAGAAEGEYVLEIGPGLGALTTKLVKTAKKTVAVDIDSGMIRILKETLSGADNLTLINADILKTDISEICEKYFDGNNFSVVGNLPYYITAKCILGVLDSGAPVSSFTAMVQLEVAERLAAAPGDSDYGALTASVGYYGAMKKLFNVSPQCFFPRPDVDSAVVKIQPLPVFEVPREAYSRTVRMLFAMRRKTLQNNLKCSLEIPSERAASLLELCGISPASRAETLSPGDFAQLAETLLREKALML